MGFGGPSQWTFGTHGSYGGWPGANHDDARDGAGLPRSNESCSRAQRCTHLVADSSRVRARPEYSSSTIDCARIPISFNGYPPNHSTWVSETNRAVPAERASQGCRKALLADSFPVAKEYRWSSPPDHALNRYELIFGASPSWGAGRRMDRADKEQPWQGPVGCSPDSANDAIHVSWWILAQKCWRRFGHKGYAWTSWWVASSATRTQE